MQYVFFIIINILILILTIRIFLKYEKISISGDRNPNYKQKIKKAREIHKINLNLASAMPFTAWHIIRLYVKAIFVRIIFCNYLNKRGKHNLNFATMIISKQFRMIRS